MVFTAAAALAMIARWLAPANAAERKRAAGAELLRLFTKVEESGAAQEKSGFGAQDPVIRQAMLQGTVNLLPGQPVVLAIPGSARQEEVTVEATAVKQAG